MWPNKTVGRIRPVAVSSLIAVLAFFRHQYCLCCPRGGERRAGQCNRRDHRHRTPQRGVAMERARFGFGLQRAPASRFAGHRYAPGAVCGAEFSFSKKRFFERRSLLAWHRAERLLALCRAGCRRVYRRRVRCAHSSCFRGIVRHRARRGPARAARNAVRPQLPRRRRQADHSQPSDQFEASAELGAGSLNARIYNGRISGPLSCDGPLEREIALSGIKRDGYSENALLGGPTATPIRCRSIRPALRG